MKLADAIVRGLVSLLAVASMLIAVESAAAATPGEAVVIEAFVRDGCPHCDKAEAFLEQLGRERPDLKIVIRDVQKDPTALERLKQLARERKAGAVRVPAIALRDQLIVGYSTEAGTDRLIRNALAGYSAKPAADAAACDAEGRLLAARLHPSRRDPHLYVTTPCRENPAMTPTTLRFIAIIALLALPVPALALDLDCKYSAERRGSLDTQGAERVEIVERAGDLTVRAAGGGTLAASGRACASTQAFLDQTRLHVRREGTVIQVHVQVPDEMKGFGIFYANLDLTVQVPSGLPVEITDTSGDISTDSVRVVSVKDSSGDIVARRLPADVVIDDSSGDIRGEEAAGDVAISDSSGDVVIRTRAA